MTEKIPPKELLLLKTNQFKMAETAFDPLTPMSIQDRISPNNINTISTR